MRRVGVKEQGIPRFEQVDLVEGAAALVHGEGQLWAVVLAPDFTLLPFAGFIDAMRHAADEDDRSRQIYCRWALLSFDEAPIRSSCGLQAVPWRRFDGPGRYDYVIVVGGLLSSMAEADPRLLAFVRAAAAAGTSARAAPRDPASTRSVWINAASWLSRVT